MEVQNANRNAFGQRLCGDPLEIRNKYNLKKDDKVHFIDYGGVLSIIPVSKNPIEAAAGMLKSEGSLLDALFKEHEEAAAKDK